MLKELKKSFQQSSDMDMQIEVYFINIYIYICIDQYPQIRNLNALKMIFYQLNCIYMIHNKTLCTTEFYIKLLSYLRIEFLLLNNDPFMKTILRKQLIKKIPSGNVYRNR